jgi:CubicO group peptidase (beta-lactamase class C family)
VLNHQAGLANAGLEEISRDPFCVCDTDLMLSIIANSKPEHGPGEQTKYHYLTFGWLVEGLVRSVTGASLREYVSANIGSKLSIDSEFMIGIPGTMDDENTVHTQSSSEKEISDRVANLVLGRIIMPPAPPKPAQTTQTTVTGTVVDEKTAARAAAAAKADPHTVTAPLSPESPAEAQEVSSSSLCELLRFAHLEKDSI